MTTGLNETHDPGLNCWLDSANAGLTDFPIQNLPFGVFRRRSIRDDFRAGVAIGDSIVDLTAAHERGLFSGDAALAAAACLQPTLNPFLGLGPGSWSALRLALSRALRLGSAAATRLRASLVPQSDAEFALPVQVGDFTDFYSSIHHATTVGSLYRPDAPLTPNYSWLPIGYHGRSSSIGISGAGIIRPRGQTLPRGSQEPRFGPTQGLDYEMELGAYVGSGNPLGFPVPMDEAEAQIFGLCLLNDWSARDVQAWEAQPLGPLLAKNFATTVSPWVVTLEALAPFRVAWQRPPGQVQALPHLDSPQNRASGALDIQLQVLIETGAMRTADQPPATLSLTSYRHAWWTLAQLVAHHTSGGCNLQPGDLLGTGTQSGPTPAEAGSLLELTRGGKEPLTLPNGETRRFLEDHDRVIMRGWCEKSGAARIGFGELRCEVLPALTSGQPVVD